MTKRVIAASFALVLLLAACGSSDSGSDGTKDGGTDDTAVDQGNTGVDGEKSDPATTSCDGYTAGEDDVINTFCGGDAEATLDIGGNEYEFTGGTCAESGGFWSVNIGVIVGPDFAGAQPDYFGGNFPLEDGEFSGPSVVVSYQADGAAGALKNVTGSRTGDQGSFKGSTIDGDIEVTGTFSC